MIEELARWFVALLGVYVTAGVVAALALHVRGLHLIDPVTRGAGFAFRSVITPGLVALWPWLLLRWRNAARGENALGEADRPVASAGLRKRHRRLAWALALLVPFLAGLALALRPPLPATDASARASLPTPDPLPIVIEQWKQPWPEFAVDVVLRGERGASGVTRQLEIDVARDLERPSLVVFYQPDGDSAGARVFLGSLPGPGTWRFALPPEAERGGAVVLHSLAHGETLGQIALPETR